MAIKNVVIPWIGGGAVLLGYAAFAWLRPRERGPVSRAELPRPEYEVAPRSDQLEPVAEGQALEPESSLPAAPSGVARHRDLGALFLGRATSALSPFQNEPSRASTAAGKL